MPKSRKEKQELADFILDYYYAFGIVLSQYEGRILLHKKTNRLWKYESK